MKAALLGTSIKYSEYGGTVWIETNDGREEIITVSTFEHLYYRLSMDVAALKDDCIDFVVFHPNRQICEYPDWFSEALRDGWITNECDRFYYLDHLGEHLIHSNDVVLRNYLGQITCKESEEFIKYYDVLEGIK